jgi:Ulp1 family protease
MTTLIISATGIYHVNHNNHIKRSNVCRYNTIVSTRHAVYNVAYRDVAHKSKKQVLTITEEKEAIRLTTTRSEAFIHSQYGIGITYNMMYCLHKGEWLNDEVVNIYFTLLHERNTRQRAKLRVDPGEATLPTCYFMNTFFTTRLKLGYRHVKRWSKRAKKK